ncbi:MAG: hypothetical protein KatS3mg031_1978 [Chitinophagales bacterium]|nr:MAG: hypothetical protein KatS3mg031_1978 [Chitinophagales bacterium]
MGSPYLTGGMLVLMLSPMFSGLAQNLENIKNERPFSLNGQVSANASYFHVAGKNSYRKPFSWIIQGNPTVSVYGVSIPFSFLITEQQRDFRQSLDRIGFTPSYRWIKLYLAFQNITWSEFSLGGHNILTAGVELTPKRFRIAALYGRLKKAIEPGSKSGFYVTPAFTRLAYCFKLGYGTDDNFFDILLLKGWDKENSLDSIPATYPLSPAENVVLALITHQKFAKHFTFDLEIANSLYTADTRISEPAGNYKGLKILAFMLNENASTRSDLAIKSSLEYAIEKFSVKFLFRRIEPGYRSMGAYYFQDDLMRFSLDPSVLVWQKKLRLYGSIGLQYDDLDNDKAVKTHRIAGMLGFSLKPNDKFSLDGSYSNYDVRQKEGTTPLDSLYEISQISHNVQLTPVLMFMNARTSNIITITGTYAKLNDRNDVTAVFSDYNMESVFANYIFSLLKHAFSVMTGFTWTRNDVASFEMVYCGPTIGVNKSFLKNQLNTGVNYSWLATVNNEVRSSTVHIVRVNASYKLLRQHQFKLSFSLQRKNSDLASVPSFTETKLDLGYAYTFNIPKNK